MAKIYEVALAALIPFTFASAQQTLTLTDGTHFQGYFAGGTPDLITFVDQGGIRHRFSVQQIQNLSFNQPYASNTYQPLNAPVINNNGGYANGAPPPPSAYGNGAYAQSGYSQNGYNPNGYQQQAPPPQNYQPQAAANGPNPPAQNSYATLNANTQIVVRTADAIHTGGDSAGKTYAATINQDVVDANGNVVVPQGSPATLVVRDAGNHQIVLDLQSVNVNGQRYALNTQDVTQTGNANRGLGANRRTGEYVGGGAVLGTLLGAIAGGGRGAAIGALAGGAVGAGTQVLTRGSEVKVPAETLLTFQLDQPVYLYQ